MGHTSNNRVVNFTCDQQLVGNFVDIRITEALPNSLRGEFVSLNDKTTDAIAGNSRHVRAFQ